MLFRSKFDAVYGGEMSAHHYFRDFFYCDSGMIPWLLIIELLSYKGQCLAPLLNERMEKFPSPGELNFKISDKDSAIKNIESHFSRNEKPVIIDHFDGLNMEFEKWRFSLRCSNTEPLIRLNLETRGDRKLMEEKLDLIKNLLKQWK